jgi:hypothetical protein
MVLEWNNHFDAAAAAYVTAIYRPDLSAPQREAAAAAFRAWIERFREGGPSAREALVAALTDADAYRRNAAARLLTELSDPEAQVSLFAAFARPENPSLSPSHLRRLEKRAPLPEVVRERLVPVSPSDEGPLDAAFYRGLTGDRAAVAFLETSAAGTDAGQAASAALRLAWLAWPGAIRPLDDLLRSEEAESIGLALNAAAALRAAALGPALLDLAGGAPDLQLELVPLPDEAIRVLENMTGQPLPDEQVDFVADAIEEEFTAATRHAAVAHYSAVLQNLNRDRRYHRGAPLTLTHLAVDLLSIHTGPVHAAAYNLRAITGEDYGFDPDDDLIANLPAIAAWRERAARAEPLTEPGGWAFAGAPLPDPSLLP